MGVDFDRRRVLAEALESRRDEIARSVTERFLHRHPDWLERYGDLAWQRGVEDAIFHVEFLAGAILADDVSAYRDYALWTAGVLEARGIRAELLAENLEQVRDAVSAGLEETDRALVHRIADAGIAAAGPELRRHAEAEAGVRGGTEAEAAHGGDDAFAVEQSLYLQAVRVGKRGPALTVAMEALRSGARVPEIYGKILQPVQYEIGRLWERNEITVAQEHMATAVTQYVVSQLYSHLEIPDVRRGNAIVTGVRGELHQLGANMVADVLEADGLNVRFLGTQLPHHGILQAIDEHQPRLIGISATILFSLPAVAELIEETRREFGSDVRVLVGGAAFRGGAHIWRDMGADGFGADLDAAVLEARRLLPEGDA